MTNTIREKMERMGTFADIIDRLISMRESNTMEWYRDDDGNTGYRDYNPDDWGQEYCDEQIKKRAIYDEVISAIEKLAVK